MKNIAILFYCLLFAGQALSQTKIFEERFNDNANAWLVANHDRGRAEVKNGGYYLECKGEDKAYFTSLPKISYKANEDFIVSFTVKWISGIDNNGYGISWGNNDSKQHCSFYITGNGSYQLLQKGNDPEKIKPWTKSPAIIKNGENKIKIVCKNKHYDFYINDLNVYSTSLTLPDSGDFYFRVNNPQVVMYDNFRIEKAATVSNPAGINTVQTTTPNSGAKPTAALTDTVTRNGVTFSVNPVWKTASDFLKKGELKTLWNYKSAFPDNANPFESFSYTVTNKAGSAENELTEKGQTFSYLVKKYFDELPATGKNLVKPADKKLAAENYVKKFLVRESFKTTDGNTGELMIYQYKELAAPFIIVTFRAIACVTNQAKNQVATLSFTFEGPAYISDYDFANEGAFASVEKQKEWIDFVTYILKSVKVKFNEQAASDIGSFVRQCTDTIAFKNISVSVNPEWKKLTGYTYPGSRALSLAEAWKAKATLPVSIRLDKFHVYLATATGTVQGKVSSMQSTQRYVLKDFYTKLNSEGLSNLSAEEIEKAAEQELVSSLSFEDITTLQGRKAKLTAKETRSITNPMVYYSFEVSALTESTVPNEYLICSFTFSMAKMLDQFSAQKQSMFATPDEKKACINFCRELAKTIKVK